MKNWAHEYLNDQQPSLPQIDAFIHNSTWPALKTFLEETFLPKMSIEYSCCSGQPGWNVKFKKSGKSITTIYPMDGFFIALVIVGPKQFAEAQLLMPQLSPSVQALYASLPENKMGKWLMIPVQDQQSLDDVKALMQFRMQAKTG